MKKIVVKIGTNVLINRDKRIVKPIIGELARQIAYLYERDIITVLVSSGSIIAGKELLFENTITNKDVREQVYSTVGQPRLMRYYYTLFADYGMRCAQILATRNDFKPGDPRNNLLNCFNGLLQQGIIPIANEDDATSLREIKISDNDQLASDIAQLINAEQLLFLSDIDGVYNGAPKASSSQKLDEIKIDQDISPYIKKLDKNKEERRGGMSTKIKIAKQTVQAGIPTIIANGKTKNTIIDILEGKPLGTKITP